jgi:hypothetical protein
MAAVPEKIMAGAAVVQALCAIAILAGLVQGERTFGVAQQQLQTSIEQTKAANDQVALAAKQFNDDYDRSRMEFTMSLWNKWLELREHGTMSRSIQHLARNDLSIDACRRIEGVAATWPKHPSAQDSEDLLIDQDMTTLLNFAEEVAAACKHGVADPKLILESFAEPFTGAYERLEPFRRACKELGRGEWPVLDEMVVTWRNERAVPPSGR